MAYLIPYQQLAKMAQPAYADDGELLDGGFDMTTGGVCGYASLCLFCFSLYNTDACKYFESAKSYLSSQDKIDVTLLTKLKLT